MGEGGIQRGHLCAQRCAYGLEEVVIVESEVVVAENEVDVLCNMLQIKYIPCS